MGAEGDGTPLVLVSPHRFPDLEPEREVLGELEAELVEAASDAELGERAAEADALLIAATPVTASLIARLGDCRAIVRYGIGVEGIDLDAATEAGVPVGNVVDASVSEVADHTVAMALSLLRRVLDAATLLDGGDWSLEPVRAVRRLSELTAGIVGLGRIGRATAERLEAFGMELIAYDPLLKDGPCPLVSLEELLDRSDLIAVHAPFSEQSRGLLSQERLQRMREGAVLVNVSRGGLVDEQALAELLREGRLGGVALDVFEVEPPPLDHPLRSTPRTILTPHVAWYSRESVREVQRKAAEQVLRGLRGERLAPVANPDVYSA